MEYKILEEHEINLLENFKDDENTIYTANNIKKFLENKNNLAFIAKENNTIYGLAYGYIQIKLDGKKMFYLYSIDILRKHQGKRYGTNLMKYIKLHGIGVTKKIGVLIITNLN